MQEFIINASKLTRIYTHGDSEVVGLDQVDLTIAAGDMVVLKGDSGSGKSTLLSLLAGLDRPTSGSLFVAKHDLSASSEKTLTLFRRKVIGMVFQSFNLLPTLSVLENVYLPAMLAGRLDEDIVSTARDYLNWIGLDHRVNHLPSQLSGGEMQRTAIARALINDPAIILADEPTGNLDSHNGETVMTLLADLNRKFKRTVIIATHSNLAEPYSSRHIHLKDGKIIFQS